MRLTTKITIGIILLAFIIPLAFIIVFSFSDRKNYHKSPFNYEVINVSQDHKKEIDVGPYQVVVLENDLVDVDAHRYWYRDDCFLSFNPVTTENEKNKLFIPEELADFIIVNTHNDTLTIALKQEALGQKYETADNDNVAISGVRLNLYTSTVDVVNRLNGVRTEIRNIKTDDMRIKAESSISIHGCDVNKVTILKAGFLDIENSRLRGLDLDCLKSLKIDNCKIQVDPDK